MPKSKQNQVTTAVTHNANTEVTVTTKVKRKWRGKMCIFGLVVLVPLCIVLVFLLLL